MNIGWKNLKIHCTIGTLKQERENPQDLFIDLEVSITPPQNDNLEHTIDYVAIAQFAQEVSERKFLLIESFAQTLLQELFDLYPILSAKLTIKKPGAYPMADHAYVTIEKKIDEYSDHGSCEAVGRTFGASTCESRS